MTKKSISFEIALNQLEEVVKKLEEGRIPLEEALELYTEGIKLAKICNNQLDMVEKKIQLLVMDYEEKDIKKLQSEGSVNEPE